MAQEGLLLHSLVNYRGIIRFLLGALKPRSLCEIGVESGKAAGFLLDYCREAGCAYVGIDPEALAELRKRIAEAGGELCDCPSLEALADLPPFDVYFLDGDHNYYTVYHELSLIFGAAKQVGRKPCLFIHDIGWPWGRRDLYYDPSRIPPDYCHEHDFHLGVALDEPGLVKGGFRSRGQFALARREGGPRNGVLTAVEDALSAMGPGLEFIAAPPVFGLGILYDPSALSDEQRAAFSSVRQALERTSDLMANLERNRLALFLHVLRLQDDMEVVSELQAQVHQLNVELFALKTAQAQVEEDQRWKQAFIDQQAAQIARDGARLQCYSYDLRRQSFLLHQLHAEIAALKASESYRATWPLRAALDQLRRARQAAARWLGERPARRVWRTAPRVESLADLGPHIARHSIISFDLFDTLLVRDVEPPDFLKRRSAKYAEMVLGQSGFPVTYGLFLDARAQVEADLRAAAARQGRDYECRLRDVISGTLELILGRDVAPRHTDDLIDYELEAERQRLALAPGAAAALEAIKKQGKRIVAVSDMYLERTHVERLLEALGIGGLVDGIYMSSDYLAGKHSRRLFRQMIEEEGADPQQVLHVGDNPISDVARPIETGIDAVWLRSRRRQKRRKKLAQLAEQALQTGRIGPLVSYSSPSGAFRRKGKDALPSEQARTLYDVGFDRIGPSFCAFVLHVAEDCLRNNVEDVYFIAREGFVFQRIYDIFNARILRFTKTPPPAQHYVFLSRLSTSLPSVEKFGDREILIGLWREEPEGLHSIFQAFSLNPEDFADICSRAGIRDMRENPPDPLNHEPYNRLFADAEFKKRLAEQRDAARADLRDYLASVGFFGANERKALVDVGWNGTIQANITRAFGGDPDFPLLSGYYYGRRQCSYHDYRCCPRSVYHPGFAYDQRRPDPHEQAVERFIPIFELTAGGPHGTTLGLRRGPDGAVEPIVKEHAQPEEVRLLQEGIFDYARQFADTYDLHEIDPMVLNKAAVQDLAAFVLRPTRAQARAVRALMHDADWGAETKFSLVSDDLKPWEWLNPKRVRRALDQSIWQEGTLRLSGVPCVFALRRAFRGARRVLRFSLGKTQR